MSKKFRYQILNTIKYTVILHFVCCQCQYAVIHYGVQDCIPELQLTLKVPVLQLQCRSHNRILKPSEKVFICQQTHGITCHKLHVPWTRSHKK